MLYDDLVKRLRERCYDCKFWDSADCMMEGKCTGKDDLEAADAIEQLSADCDMYRKAMADEHNRAARLLWEKEHCWIPVTEKENLPNTDSGVVGYFGGGAFDQLRWYDFVSTLSDGSIVSENSERNVQNEHCIAVFKLPEPPKENDK